MVFCSCSVWEVAGSDQPDANAADGRFAGEAVVPASELAEARAEIAKVPRVLDKKTWRTESSKTTSSLVYFLLPAYSASEQLILLIASISLPVSMAHGMIGDLVQSFPAFQMECNMQISATKITVALLVVAVCAGCASTPQAVTPEALTRYKRIGVISLAAQTFTRQYVGFTVFNNEIEKADSSTWNVDVRYEQKISQELAALGGIDVVQGPYSRQEFMHIDDLNGPWDAPAFRDSNWAAIEKPIRDYCLKNQVDGIVFTSKSGVSDFLTGSNQWLFGAGIYARGSSRNAILHLIARSALVDCQTAKPVAARYLATDQENGTSQMLKTAPMGPISGELMNTPLRPLSDAQVAIVTDALAELPSKAWRPTLRALFGR